MTNSERVAMFKGLLGSLVKQLTMIVVMLSILFPLYFIAVTAFKDKMDYVNNKLGFPTEVIFANFSEAFRYGSFHRWFLNSTILTLGSGVMTIILGCLAAYAFARMVFVGKSFILNITISLMAIPPAVMLIPLFVLMTKTKLVNTYYSVIIIYTGLLLPFSTYLLRNFFITIPQDIIDSARIDGCSNFQILWRIMLPLSKPALVTLIVTNALWTWNELFIALIFLQPQELKTLMVGLTIQQGRFQINQPVIMAGVLAAVLPMILLYLVGQRYLVAGLLAGSLKGE